MRGGTRHEARQRRDGGGWRDQANPFRILIPSVQGLCKFRIGVAGIQLFNGRNSSYSTFGTFHTFFAGKNVPQLDDRNISY
jgi:hypothetical protein